MVGRMTATLRADVQVEGAGLATEVHLPDALPAPASLFRTPYGRENYLPDPAALLPAGVALVNQDVRGRFGSTGIFAMGATDIADGGAAVDWAASQPWCDGRVAGRGMSYPGMTQWGMALARPAGLVCAGPMMAPAFWRGMSMREGGALQLALAAHWLPRQAAEAPGVPERIRELLYAGSLEFEQIVVPNPDDPSRWEVSLSRALQHPALAAAPLRSDERFHGVEPFASWWRGLFEPPWPEPWFNDPGPLPTQTVDAPMLVMGGWYDLWSHEATVAFRHIQQTSAPAIARSHRLVMAPFGHGNGWAGELPRPVDAERFLCDLDIRWSLEWLLDQERTLRDMAPVTYWCYGRGWCEAPEWPPPGLTRLRLFLGAGSGELSAGPPTTASRARYLYDPANPVPTRGGRTLGLPAGPCRQDGVTAGARADVVSFDAEVAAGALLVCGEVVAHLFVASSAPCTDFTAKLVDVDPAGVAFGICDGITRTAFRNPGRGGAAMRPGEPVELRVHLGSIAYLLAPGHHLRLDISSSNFPWYDRNPNTDAPEGSSTVSSVAEQEVWTAPAMASFVEFLTSDGGPMS